MLKLNCMVIENGRIIVVEIDEGERVQKLKKRLKELAAAATPCAVSDICWSSSVAMDYAIFKIAVDQTVPLARCAFGMDVAPTMHVHIFGFPAALRGQFRHVSAIIPAEVTGAGENKLTLSALSAPGLSGGAIVCTKRGTPVLGYMGGNFDSSANNQYQSYGFNVQGLPRELPFFEGEEKALNHSV